MKIAIDARQYSTTTGRYISRLVQYLEKVDTVNDYIVLLKPADMGKYQPNNPKFTKITCPYKEFSFAEQLGFAIQLYKLDVDLVHFGMTQQPLLYLRPKVTTIHDLITARFKNPDKQPLVFWIKQQVYKAVIVWSARTSRQVITPTEYVRQDVLAYTKASPRRVSATLESADHIQDNPEPVEAVVGKRFVMYIGRPTPHKNLERLITAFQSLKGQHPDLQLVLAGKLDNNYRRIQQNVQTEQIANIIFTDYVSEGQLRWLYEHCSAYVFPSLSEGFGLPGLEAMLHGAPVVSSNASCLPEVYGDAAHYFDPTDTVSMADAINEVLTDEQLHTTLITAGRAQAATYSWQRMAEQTVALYTKAAQA